MKNLATAMLAVAMFAFLTSMLPCEASAADTPTGRVVVMYFHRTQRCPTCLKMGSYSEEAVKSKFAKQVKGGTVGFYSIDFQAPRNEALAKRYDISGPALVVAKVVGNQVVDSHNLTEIWTKVADKRSFFTYVQEAVAAYRQSSSRPQERAHAADTRAR